MGELVTMFTTFTSKKLVCNYEKVVSCRGNEFYQFKLNYISRQLTKPFHTKYTLESNLYTLLRDTIMSGHTHVDTYKVVLESRHEHVKIES